MGENSKIQWTNHTHNFWIGCDEVSPACDHCYARTLAERYGWAKWGPKEPRHRTSAENWKKPGRWNRVAQATGINAKVFPNSLSDFFDNKVAPDWRHDAWKTIRETPWLTWQILTKRPQNIPKMLPPDWGDGWNNVWLGTTVENNTEAERRIPPLLSVPARIHFLSCEPMLEEFDITRWLWGPENPCEQCPQDEDCECGWKTRKELGLPSIDWVICGGESGPDKRPMDLAWARSLQHQCKTGDVPFFMKQIDGKLPIPADLMIREFPQ